MRRRKVGNVMGSVAASYDLACGSSRKLVRETTA